MPGFVPPRPPRPAPKPFHEPDAPIYGRNVAGAKVVTANKPVTSFTHGGVRGTVKKAPTKVVLHPDGRVEIVHHSAPAKVAPAPSAAPDSPVATGSVVTHPTPHPTVKPKPHVVTRTPAAPVRPGAPALTLQQQAQALLDPVVQSTTGAIDTRIKAQQDAINSSTQTLANLMGQYAPASKAAYGNAQAGQAAVDAATGATLAGQGQAGQAELAAQLAKIDADPGTAARINAAQGANVQGASGAMAARGASSLSDLISRGASAQDYGAKLPGVAGEYGLQATKQAQSQGTTDTANAVAQLQAKLPDIIQQLKTNGTQQQQIRFERGAALLQANGGVVTPEIKKLLGGALPTGATPKAKADAAAAAAKQAAADQKQANSDRNYKLSVAKYGLSEDKLMAQLLKDQKTAETKGKLHGLSQTTYQAKQATALGLARIGHQPYTDGDGTVHPGVSWQQYLNGALSKKVPMWVAIEQGKRIYSQAEIRQGLIPGSK